MKKIFNISFLLASVFTFAQVAIGKNSVTNTSVSLEFGNYDGANGKGIILPWVDNSAIASEKGTIILDSSDKLVKYKKADGSWFNLSKNEDTNIGGNPINTTGVVDRALQTNKDLPTAKTSVGTPTATPGILVLEDVNKAMILPLVPTAYTNIKNPEPGTIAYDTTNNLLCIYNGKVWSFWKANP